MMIMDWDRLEPFADMSLEDLDNLKSNLVDSISELNQRLLRVKAARVALMLDTRCEKKGGGCCGEATRSE